MFICVYRILDSGRALFYYNSKRGYEEGEKDSVSIGHTKTVTDVNPPFFLLYSEPVHLAKSQYSTMIEQEKLHTLTSTIK